MHRLGKTYSLIGDGMSYNIQYEVVTVRQYPTARKRRKYSKVLVVVGVAFAALIVLLHITATRRLLLPGDPVVTERAIVKMADELRAGEGLQEAFSAFCQEVIQGGLAE